MKGIATLDERWLRLATSGSAVTWKALLRQIVPRAERDSARAAIDKARPFFAAFGRGALGNKQSVLSHSAVALAPDMIGKTSASNPAAAA
jgi:hypothetical protein